MTDKTDGASGRTTATELMRPDMADRTAAIESVTCLWHCWVDGCGCCLHAIEEEADGLPFVIVRHLIKEHGVRPDAIVAREPWLAAEVKAYCDAFGLEPPVEGQTGVPTKMGMAEVQT